MTATTTDESATTEEPAVPAAGMEQVESSMSDSSSNDDELYKKIGFKEDQIALGLDPEEILEYMGTRDDIVAKFKTDNPKFDDARVELEVSKFMMDYENCYRWITYKKKAKYEAAKPKVATPAKSASSEPAEPSLMEQFADPGVIGVYAFWITAGVGFSLFKNQIAEPKFASGEWEDIHFDLGEIMSKFTSGGSGAADVIAAPAVSAEVVQSTVDTVTGALN